MHQKAWSLFLFVLAKYSITSLYAFALYSGMHNIKENQSEILNAMLCDCTGSVVILLPVMRICHCTLIIMIFRSLSGNAHLRYPVILAGKFPGK